MTARVLDVPCCSSVGLMDPEWSLSCCWNSALHRCMKSHRAEKPNTSILPDRVLSNMSDEERFGTTQLSVPFQTNARCIFPCKRHHPSHAESRTLDYGHDTLVRWNVRNTTNDIIVVISWTSNSTFVASRRVAEPAPLTDHHEAGLVVERRPVGVDERLLQLLQVDEAAVVRVNTQEPLVGLRVHARGDVSCNHTELSSHTGVILLPPTRQLLLVSVEEFSLSSLGRCGVNA